MKKTITVLCIALFLFLCCGLFSTAIAESANENVTICVLRGEPENEKVAERTFSETLETPVSFVSNAEVKLRLVSLMFAQHCRVSIFCDEKNVRKVGNTS